MINLSKIIIVIFIFFLQIEKNLLASDIYFVDYSKVMNESIAGKKAQDYLKKLINNSNKKFQETAKKLKNEEKNIISQKNALSKEEYKKKADALRKKVFELNQERERSIKEVAKMFHSSTRYLKRRPGERYASALTKISLKNRLIRRFGKIDLKDYITSFIKEQNLWK